jgi:hypothetical protein
MGVDGSGIGCMLTGLVTVGGSPSRYSEYEGGGDPGIENESVVEVNRVSRVRFPIVGD